MSAVPPEASAESDAVDASFVLRVGVMGLAVAGVAVLVAGLVVSSRGGLRPSAAGSEGARPAPRTLAGVEQPLFDRPAEELDRLGRQRRALDSWGWVDRDGGVARIPIDRAIQIVVDEGKR